MALWKPFLGNRASLNDVEKHAGYVYWCADDGSLHFDYIDTNGNLQRKQINADTLTGSLGSAQITHGEDLLSDIIDEKVDKIQGKGLSTNDFTNDYKIKLDKIADGDVAKWNTAEQNAKDYADDLIEALGTMSKETATDYVKKTGEVLSFTETLASNGIEANIDGVAGSLSFYSGSDGYHNTSLNSYGDIYLNATHNIFISPGNDYSCMYKNYEIATTNITDALSSRIDTLTSGGLTRKIVTSLDDIAEPNDSTIYMVGPDTTTTGDNIYAEYMYINGAYEQIGSTSVDLTGYLKSDRVTLQDLTTQGYEHSKLGLDTAYINMVTTGVMEVNANTFNIPTKTYMTGNLIPTADNQVVSKKYVDDAIDALRTELKAYIDETLLGGTW